jgi:ribonuclease P protein component
VIVSKKIEKSSVKRHQIKRRVVSQIKTINTKSCFDFVITLKNNLKDKNYLEIREKLAELLI